MSLADRKITSTDITSKGVVAAPDTMTGTAQENKMVFDRLIREVVKEDMNGVIDDLMASTAAAEIGFDTPEDMTADNVQDAIEEIKDDTETGVAKAIAEALKSEGYAVGKQNGVDVESGSTYYHNNSKYYSEQASGSADTATAQAGIATTKAGNASDSATAASGYANDALGYRNTAEAHKNDASDYKDAAAASALSASGSATAADNSETNASAKALVSEGYALGKQNGIDVEEGSEYYHNNAKYFKEQAGEASVGYVSYASAQSIPTSGKLQARTNIDAEDFGNKVTSVNSSSSDTQYPSAKLLYDTKVALESADSTLNLNKADRADVYPLINIWDEQWEVGGYGSSGQKIANAQIRNANPIKVKSSTQYYMNGGNPAYHDVFFYDANMSFISKDTSDVTLFTTPSNCHYINFQKASAYGTTYNNDISINYPSTYHDYYPSALPRTNARVGGLGNVIGMRGWNQLVPTSAFPSKTESGITFTNNGNGTISVSGTASSVVVNAFTYPFISGRKYALFGCPSGGAYSTYSLDVNGSGDPRDTGNGVIFTASSTSSIAIRIRISWYSISGTLVFKPQLFDLTALFGAGNEPSSVSDFRAMFPADYYPYCSGGFADLIWTNASPTASFSAQTVNLDLSKYKFVMIDYLLHKDYSNHSIELVSIGATGLSFGNFSGKTTKRTATVSASNIAFSVGGIYTSYASGDTGSGDVMIPYKIYGVR